MRASVMSVVGIAALGTVVAAGPGFARGLGEAAEAEAARMNAKAGGPTNYRDAELLERYGCRDKTDSEYCWHLYKKQRGFYRHSHKKSRRY